MTKRKDRDVGRKLPPCDDNPERTVPTVSLRGRRTTQSHAALFGPGCLTKACGPNTTLHAQAPVHQAGDGSAPGFSARSPYFPSPQVIPGEAERRPGISARLRTTSPFGPPSFPAAPVGGDSAAWRFMLRGTRHHAIPFESHSATPPPAHS